VSAGASRLRDFELNGFVNLLYDETTIDTYTWFFHPEVQEALWRLIGAVQSEGEKAEKSDPRPIDNVLKGAIRDTW
jgi:hypothetical protein